MMTPSDLSSSVDSPPSLSSGERYEKIAFNFCKAATIILLTQQYALTVASGAAAVLYLMAHFHGKKDTRCILRSPLLTASFWGLICLASVYAHLRSYLSR